MEFVAFLQANKVPEHLFDELVAKIEDGAVGSDGLFQVCTCAQVGMHDERA